MESGVHDYIILGGGISGLSHLHYLRKKTGNILLLEKENRTGGKIISETRADRKLEWGPNSYISADALSDLIRDCGLESEVMYSDSAAYKRLIYKAGDLHELKPDPGKILTSKLFSTRGKWKLLKEQWMKPSPQPNESVASFVRRRFGPDALDYAVDPMLAGIYAGDPEQLSVDAVFPFLPAWEKKYGSIIKGLRQNAQQLKATGGRKVFSFREGNQQLVNRLFELNRKHIQTGVSVQSVSKEENKWKVVFSDETGILCTNYAKSVISAIPAYELAALLMPVDKRVGEKLSEIVYPALSVFHIEFHRKDIGRPLDSFGFLVPAKAQLSFLGAIWDSVVFPERTASGTCLFTLFVGGMRNPELLTLPQAERENRIMREFAPIMKIQGNPVYSGWKNWPRAIPQYNLNYAEILQEIERFEVENPNFFVRGNFRGGIGLKDAVASANAFSG